MQAYSRAKAFCRVSQLQSIRVCLCVTGHGDRLIFALTFTHCSSHQQRGPGRGLTVYSLLQELARRDGLSVALSGRNEEELFPILKYLARFMTHPQYAPLLLDVCTMVIGG